MLLDIDLRDLELLEALEQHRTLTAAADHLFVSQPALSQRLLRLEQRLGTTLFERGPRGLTPTPAGDRMLTAARVALHEVRNAVREVTSPGDTHQSPTVRLWTQCSTNYYWLPPVMQAFRRAHPEADVAVMNLDDAGYVDAIESGDLDVALVTKLDRQLDRVRLHELFDDELVAIVAPDHPFAGRARIDAAAFSLAHVMLFESYDQTRVPATPLPLPPGATPASITYVPLVTDLLVESVAVTDRIAVLPSWTAAPYVAAGLVRSVPIGTSRQGRTWYAATRRGRQTELVRDFLTELRRTVDAGEHERQPARLAAV